MHDMGKVNKRVEILFNLKSHYVSGAGGFGLHSILIRFLIYADCR